MSNREAHGVFIAESDVTRSKMEEVELPNFTLTYTSCREGNRTKGVERGGDLMCVRDPGP